VAVDQQEVPEQQTRVEVAAVHKVMYQPLVLLVAQELWLFLTPERKEQRVVR
jgi:hypothetical protein